MPKTIVLSKKQPSMRRYVVDRIEDDGKGKRIAVLEDQADGSSMNLPLAKLPSAREGALFAVPTTNGQPDWARAQRQQAEEQARKSAAARRMQAMRTRTP